MSDARVMPLLLGASLAWPDGRLTAASVTYARTASGAQVLIDTGAWHQRRALMTALERLGLRTTDFDAIIITHLHWDHCMNFDLFEGVTLAVSRGEWERVTRAEFDHATPTYLQALFENHGKMALLDPGEYLGLNIVAAPGHTAGHIAVGLETGEQRVVVAGDAVPTRTAASTGMPHAWHASAEDAAATVARLTTEYDVVVPGHDSVFSTRPADLILSGPYPSEGKP